MDSEKLTDKLDDLENQKSQMNEYDDYFDAAKIAALDIEIVAIKAEIKTRDKKAADLKAFVKTPEYKTNAKRIMAIDKELDKLANNYEAEATELLDKIEALQPLDEERVKLLKTIQAENSSRALGFGRFGSLENLRQALYKACENIKYSQQVRS